MKVLYILPGSLSRTELGTREIDRRRAVLQRLAAPGTEVDIVDVPDGPSSIESAYEEYLSVPGTLAHVQTAARAGYAGPRHRPAPTDTTRPRRSLSIRRLLRARANGAQRRASSRWQRRSHAHPACDLPLCRSPC